MNPNLKNGYQVFLAMIWPIAKSVIVISCATQNPMFDLMVMVSFAKLSILLLVTVDFS